jgi:hypothetical protein
MCSNNKNYITHSHRNDSIEVDKRVGNLRTYIRKHWWWIQLTEQEPNSVKIKVNDGFCQRTKDKLDFLCVNKITLKDDMAF